MFAMKEGSLDKRIRKPRFVLRTALAGTAIARGAVAALFATVAENISSVALFTPPKSPSPSKSMNTTNLASPPVVFITSIATFVVWPATSIVPAGQPSSSSGEPVLSSPFAPAFCCPLASTSGATVPILMPETMAWLGPPLALCVSWLFAPVPAPLSGRSPQS